MNNKSALMVEVYKNEGFGYYCNGPYDLSIFKTHEVSGWLELDAWVYKHFHKWAKRVFGAKSDVFYKLDNDNNGIIYRAGFEDMPLFIIHTRNKE